MERVKGGGQDGRFESEGAEGGGGDGDEGIVQWFPPHRGARDGGVASWRRRETIKKRKGGEGRRVSLTSASSQSTLAPQAEAAP